MVAPIQIGGSIQIGSGINIGTSSSPPPPTTEWDSNPGTHILEYSANGDGTGTVTYYVLNCTNQTPDPATSDVFTYFQVWIRNAGLAPAEIQATFTVYDATLAQSYTITPTAAVTSVDGGQTFSCPANSSAPNLTNSTIITQA